MDSTSYWVADRLVDVPYFDPSRVHSGARALGVLSFIQQSSTHWKIGERLYAVGLDSSDQTRYHVGRHLIHEIGARDDRLMWRQLLLGNSCVLQASREESVAYPRVYGKIMATNLAPGV